MRKYVSMILFVALATLAFSSCDPETDEKPGGTKVEKMAGFWDVTIDAINADGTVKTKDPEGVGTVSMLTYNTVENVDNRMWIKLPKKGAFLQMHLIVPVNYGAKTFSCEATKYIYNSNTAGNVTITDGKVLLGQGHNLHGLPTDSIVFNAVFSDDPNNLTYRIAGIRHSGFTE